MVPGITWKPPPALLDVLLYGSKKFDFDTNKGIITSTITYIKDTKRFKKLEAYSQV